MEKRSNKNRHEYWARDGHHLRLNDLKQVHSHVNKYLFKENIPAYPQPEFQVCRLKHDTWGEGLHGIKMAEGFRDLSKDSLVWWSLSVGPEEIKSAETRLLEEKYEERTEEQVAMQQSFLWKFATSPAFLETSRLGSYRFTFPLEELLTAYSEQFCSGQPPVMRVKETDLYKQEVVHVVLVHSPANQEKFSEYPLLTDDPNAVCVYRNGCFIWRPEAMSETHWFELIHRDEEMQMEAQRVFNHQFYVWDNVVIALHVENRQVLKFNVDQLRENLKFCGKGYPPIKSDLYFDSFEDAKDKVEKLWPDGHSPLEKERSLKESFTDQTAANAPI
ncbi:uncharacterized protein [Brachyistius frenatus]|uniref:uncharacterized protein n=1 Tax=Brachyistius frenatus TaxID=100188 RepID=UPI0037E9952A